MIRSILNFIFRKEIKRWHRENFEFGKQLGYPECCIHEFCQDAPIILKIRPTEQTDFERYSAGCIPVKMEVDRYEMKFTGFIPCKKHAKQILSGEIKIEDLINNRNPYFPKFPTEPFLPVRQ